MYADPGNLSDNQYKFWVQAEGPSSGQWSQWASCPFRIDTVWPSTPSGLTNPGGASSTTDTTPNVTWSGSSDSGSGVWIYDVNFTKGSTSYTFPSTNTVLEDSDFGGTTLALGFWTWKVRAIDVAGNTSSWSTGKTIEIVAPDTTAPTPNPSTWATKPTATGTTSIHMVAATATDPSGVEYSFECMAGGGHSSGWQDSPTYDDTGLQPNTTYSYRVRTRDKSANQNTGNWSTTESATTPPPPDTEGPYTPGNVRMSPSSDTVGQSNSDGITYIGNPQFEWTKPADRPASGASGTKDYYQWAVTLPSDNPWTGSRIKEGFTSSTSVQPGTLPDTGYKFWVQAQDNTTNWGDWGDTTFRIDTVAPTVPSGLTNPGGASLTTDTQPYVCWIVSTDSGSGVWTYDVQFSKGSTTYNFPSADACLDDSDYGGTTLSPGIWTWKVRAIDVAGNTSSWSTGNMIEIVALDTEGPYAPGNVRMSPSSDTVGQSNSDGITYIGNPQFEWTKPADRPASGASGTKDYYQWAVTLPSDNPWTGSRIKGGFTSSTSVQPGTLPDTGYKFWVQAQDDATNWGDWGDTTFRIDTAAPGIPTGLTNPGGSSSTTDTTPNVTWTASTDSGSGVWTYDVEFTQGTTTHAFPSDDSALDDVDFGDTVLAKGNWTWKVRAIDVAGNASEWSTAKPLWVGPQSQTITVNTSSSCQTIVGFGGAFAMWGYAPDDAALIKVTRDLGATIVRIQGDAGGYIPGGQWQANDAWIRSSAAAKAAAMYGVDKFVLSFWYPPSEYLDSDRHWDGSPAEAWAQAIAMRIDELGRGIWSINPDATIWVSPQNEPNMTDQNKATWAYWNPDQLYAFVHSVRAALNNRLPIDYTKVFVVSPELTSVRPWDSASGDATKWSDYSSLIGFATNADLAAVCYHMYDSYAATGSDPGFEGVDGLSERCGRLRTAIGTRASWMTETTGPQWNTAGWHTLGWRPGMSPIEKAIGAARYIHYAMAVAESSAFLWWGLTYADPSDDVLAASGVAPSDPTRPFIIEKFRDEGLVLVDHYASPMHEVSVSGTTQKYYSFKQFSQYVRPGYVRIGVTYNSPLEVTAYRTPAADSVSIVIINPSTTDVQLTVTGVGTLALAKVVETDVTHNCEEITAWNGVIPRQSVVTLVYGDTSSLDTSPPGPNPSTWATKPTATGTTSIHMAAATATDPSGVEYSFECMAGGGHSSDWQDSATYDDTGLQPNTAYSYHVRTRDKSASHNTGNWSTTESATTRAVPDTLPPSPNPSTWGTKPEATGTTSIHMVATTAADPSGVQYSFECTAGGGHNSGWQDNATYDDTGLQPNTMYSYRVQTRDKSLNQNTGDWSSTESAITESPPAYGTTIVFTEITLNGQSLSDPAPTLDVTAGQPISGNVGMQIDRKGPKSSIFPVAGTVSWDQNERVAISTNLSPGIYNRTYAISKTAPSTPGTYWIAVAAGPMYNIDEILGCDHSPAHGGPPGGPYGNGNDIWDWSAGQFGQAFNNLPVDCIFDASNVTVLARAVKINVSALPDTLPPSPNPSTWVTKPEATGARSIHMVATTATDPENNGVEYFFECVAGGGHNSGWQDNATYDDTGLQPNTAYSYQVQTRDKSVNQNTGGWSTTESATTQALAPADFDHDGDVDSADLALFAACASGPAIPYSSGCEAKDLDPDGDIDQSDFGVFQRCYSGPDRPAIPECAFPQVNAPVFTPSGGDYVEPVEVAISCSTPGSTIRYTVDESEPTTASAVYVGPFTLDAPTTVRAVGMSPGGLNGATCGRVKRSHFSLGSSRPDGTFRRFPGLIA